ncbi:aminoglycoside phosphotransferase (APT) family kinase protein [Spinactinospora alkalitolerans]|uniref:Aminoglycoside phosphotransferase (APT) family kinase protein n=1 Tax=Spinactinospora alkalitolerans TaxID=687207 RepID=A0A852TZX2_9ACTN|nr:phosphotransferase [Spinactinospora alkalitolerans]NYE49549.1 aminoglycoside phosphotransferase (APT) family kinase protein [Spinactinospora alkalitolerans]
MNEAPIRDRAFHLSHPVTDERLRLRRAWPRDEGHLLLEWETPHGEPVPGQWFADPARLNRAAAATEGAVPLPEEGVLLQPDGADRRLPALHGLVARADARLIAHRPERRAVVRTAEGYAKVVRPERVADLVSRCERAARYADGAFTVPELIRAEDSGVTLWSALPGEPLHELSRATRVGDPLLAWYRAGAALAALHAVPADGGGGVGPGAHTPADERAAVLRWLGPARRFGLLPDVDPEPALAPLFEADAARIGPVHRDCYDKQFVADPADERIGLLDMDTLTTGEPALDAANVLVHIALRRAQGRLTPGRAEAFRSAFLSGLRPDRETHERIPAYAAAARLRLAGVYAFRPRWRRLARDLMNEALRSSPAAARP